MNYSYDPLGRMTEADYRHGTGLNGDQSLQTPLSLSDVNTLDSRVAYDMNGRIAGKRSGGVSSGDSAAYVYYDDSYRVERVTGKPSGSSLRDASATGNFRYDEAGNMVHDASKALSITYNYDGMPREFMVVDTPSVTMHQLYDVGGQRVTQIVAAGGALTFWVGAGNDGAAPYDFSTVGQAMTSLQTRLATRAGQAPDSVVLFVVAEDGSEIYPGVSEMSLVTMNTDTVRVVIHGMQKYSSQHVAHSRNQVGRSLRAQHWVNMGGQVMSEVREVYDTTGALIDRRVVANVYGRGMPIGRYITDSSKFEFYVKNHLGSIMRVVNTDGSYATTPAFDYQPYGELQTIREDSMNPVTQKFTGKAVDTEVNLYYFGARWYDQELGLWLTPDPAGQYLNTYSYGNGMIIIGVDSDGRLFGIDDLVVGIVGGGIAYVSGGINNGDWANGRALYNVYNGASSSVAGYNTGIVVTAATGGCFVCGYAAGSAVASTVSSANNFVADKASGGYLTNGPSQWTTSLGPVSYNWSGGENGGLSVAKFDGDWKSGAGLFNNTMVGLSYVGAAGAVYGTYGSYQRGSLGFQNPFNQASDWSLVNSQGNLSLNNFASQSKASYQAANQSIKLGQPSQPEIPEGRASHIFGEREGHLPDSPANRQFLQNVANANNYKGIDIYGNTWYTKVLPDGSQVWVQVRNGIVINGGVNSTPRPWIPGTGLSGGKKR